jgi:hypothetical protein
MDEHGSTVARTTAPSHLASIAVDLGYRPSDLLQTNAILWVEGPSDRLYLRNWLNVAAGDLIEGTHFSIMFYGGRLLNHLSANDPDVDDFISLRRLNRNVAILMDSDRARPGERLNATKRRVRDEVDAGPGIAWVTAGRTIENYVPQDRLRGAVAAVHPHLTTRWAGARWTSPFAATQLVGTPKVVDKVRVARLVVADWSTDRDWPFDLAQRVAQLERFIREANASSN